VQRGSCKIVVFTKFIIINTTYSLWQHVMKFMLIFYAQFYNAFFTIVALIIKRNEKIKISNKNFFDNF